jgi:hypothetical protein
MSVELMYNCQNRTNESMSEPRGGKWRTVEQRRQMERTEAEAHLTVAEVCPSRGSMTTPSAPRAMEMFNVPPPIPETNIGRLRFRLLAVPLPVGEEPTRVELHGFGVACGSCTIFLRISSSKLWYMRINQRTRDSGW